MELKPIDILKMFQKAHEKKPHEEVVAGVPPAVEACYWTQEGGLWVRPAKMFFENVTRDGKTFRRFALLEDEE